MVTQSFLLEKAHDMSTVENESWYYDNELHMNTVIVDGKPIPVCAISSMITASKTEAAPGDDDPDPDVEFMY